MKKKLIITGCNGQLGRAINKQLAGNEDYELVNTDVAELDITDIDKVMEMAREVKPYAILNCAAFTNVNGCETAGDIVWKINALGPRNLSIAATETGAKMMHISTDYVFNGNGTRPYTEFDTPDPQSAYGVTKLAGEKFVQQFAKEFFIIRTAWLYGDGNNFVKTMLRLAERRTRLSVVDDQIGCPTYTVDLARLICQMAEQNAQGVFHAAGSGQPVSWYDFARRIFDLSGKEIELEPISTAAYPTAARRPLNSRLDCSALAAAGLTPLPEWQDALARYLQALEEEKA